MRDSQRQKVYDWEAALAIDPREMSPKAISELANKVREDYGRSPLKRIIFSRSWAVGSWGGTSGRMRIGRSHRNLQVVLHEIAHTIISAEPAHGPAFARFVAELYERYAGVPMSVSRKAATEHRVRWSKAAATPFAVTREERKLKERVRLARIAYNEAEQALAAYRKRRRGQA